MLEEIKYYKKEYVFDSYSRIVEDFKDYEKITKVNMLKAIFNVYSDYQNIIDICTTRELKYLKMLLEKKSMSHENKYKWEENMLQKKFLIFYNIGTGYQIIKELENNIKLALKNVKWNETKAIDKLNEILVSICKIQGTILVESLIQISSSLLGVKETVFRYHILNNQLFKFYVSLELITLESIGEQVEAIYNDYYHLKDELAEERKKQGGAFTTQVNIKDYISLFYNDFNMNNPKIKKFYKETITLPFFYIDFIEYVQEYALLNRDRTSLKNALINVPALKDIDLTDYLKDMDVAMDEMPSGALNGCTPNEVRKQNQENIEYHLHKHKKYIPQKNACLSKKERDLFYKLYFGLLDFTNQKYKIKPKLKIYKQIGLNPHDLSEIIDKLWKNKEANITEFVLANPYKFSKEELEIVKGFKKGIRKIFFIMDYLEEYTAIMDEEKCYMIKGITSNIDEIIPYNELPYIAITTILPFEDKLIYDSLFFSMDIDFGINFKKAAEKDYQNRIKYYHL